MCLVKYHVLIFCLTIECYALNCRTDGGPKEAELKSIYKKCLKMQQDGKNSTKGNSDQDWKESRSQLHSNNWERGRMGNNRNNNRDDRMSGRGNVNTRDDMMGVNGGGMGGSSDRMGGKTDRMGSNRDRTDSNSDKRGSRGDNTDYSDRMRGRNNRYDNSDGSRNDRYGQNEYFNRREDFPQSGEYGSGMSQYSSYHSTSSPRRYKREKRPENSGQRSQYNPNTHKISGYEGDFRSDEKNSSENNSSKEMDNKACALHCFMENLEMTGENGMPDRYLVTHAITKDVKNEDLKDFLQESIEECFQILDNENAEEKCEFSKNLMVCLSEKGRANCDDWKDDLKF